MSGEQAVVTAPWPVRTAPGPGERHDGRTGDGASVTAYGPLVIYRPYPSHGGGGLARPTPVVELACHLTASRMTHPAGIHPHPLACSSPRCGREGCRGLVARVRLPGPLDRPTVFPSPLCGGSNRSRRVRLLTAPAHRRRAARNTEAPMTHPSPYPRRTPPTGGLSPRFVQRRTVTSAGTARAVQDEGRRRWRAATAPRATPTAMTVSQRVQTTASTSVASAAQEPPRTGTAVYARKYGLVGRSRRRTGTAVLTMKNTTRCSRTSRGTRRVAGRATGSRAFSLPAEPVPHGQDLGRAALGDSPNRDANQCAPHDRE